MPTPPKTTKKKTSTKTAARKPAARKPAARKPTARKPTARKPAAKMQGGVFGIKPPDIEKLYPNPGIPGRRIYLTPKYIKEQQQREKFLSNGGNTEYWKEMDYLDKQKAIQELQKFNEKKLFNRLKNSVNTTALTVAKRVGDFARGMRGKKSSQDR